MQAACGSASRVGGQRARFEPYKGIFNFNHVPLLVPAVTGVFTVALFRRCYGNACPNLTSVQGREEAWNIYGLVKVILGGGGLGGADLEPLFAGLWSVCLCSRRTSLLLNFIFLPLVDRISSHKKAKQCSMFSPQAGHTSLHLYTPKTVFAPASSQNWPPHRPGAVSHTDNTIDVA